MAVSVLDKPTVYFYSSSTRTLTHMINRFTDIKLEDELLIGAKGKQVLTFSFLTDSARNSIMCEQRIVFDATIYVIKTIKDAIVRNKLVTQVTANALWYELSNGYHYGTDRKVNTAKLTVLNEIMATTSHVNLSISYTDGGAFLGGVHFEYDTILKSLRTFAELTGCELSFSCDHNPKNSGKLVDNVKAKFSTYTSIESAMPKGRKHILSKEYGVTGLERFIDSRKMVNMFTLTGKDGVTMAASHPQGLTYYEDFSWESTNGFPRVVRNKANQDDRYRYPSSLYEAAKAYVEANNKPLMSYSGKINLFKSVPQLGDVVEIRDSELKLRNDFRISSRVIDYMNISKSTVTASDTRPDLVDLF